MPHHNERVVLILIDHIPQVNHRRSHIAQHLLIRVRRGVFHFRRHGHEKKVLPVRNEVDYDKQQCEFFKGLKPLWSIGH